MQVPYDRPLTPSELEKWEAHVNEDIRRYLAAHEGDKYSGSYKSSEET